MKDSPTGFDVLDMGAGLLAPTLFGIACMTTYKPDTSALGVALALIGFQTTRIWGHTLELRARARNEWKGN